MLDATYTAVPTGTEDIDLFQAFNLGIDQFKCELEKLTDREYVTLLTLLDEYRSPF
jgi:hypothetical protein